MHRCLSGRKVTLFFNFYCYSNFYPWAMRRILAWECVDQAHGNVQENLTLISLLTKFTNSCMVKVGWISQLISRLHLLSFDYFRIVVLNIQPVLNGCILGMQSFTLKVDSYHKNFCYLTHRYLSVTWMDGSWTRNWGLYCWFGTSFSWSLLLCTNSTFLASSILQNVQALFKSDGSLQLAFLYI